jgi:hypothetical protein
MGLDIELIKHRLNASTGAIAIDSPNSVEDELLTKLVLEVAQPLEYPPYYWNLSKGLQQLSVTRQRGSNVTTGIKKTPVEDHKPDNPVTGLLKFIRDLLCRQYSRVLTRWSSAQFVCAARFD